MAVGQSREISIQRRPFERLSQYDVLLLAIPLAFVLGAVLATAAGLSLRTGVSFGGVVAVVTTGYALFGVPPTDDPPRSRGIR